MQGDEWIPSFRRYLAELLEPLSTGEMKPSPKVLGVCFGHQVIAHSLGGRSGRAAVGWEIGVKTMKLHPEGLSMFSSEMGGKASLEIFESHQDQVGWTLAFYFCCGGGGEFFFWGEIDKRFRLLPGFRPPGRCSLASVFSKNPNRNVCDAQHSLYARSS